MQFRVPAVKAHIDGMVTSLAKTLNEMMAVGDRLEGVVDALDVPLLRDYPPHIRKVVCKRIQRMIESGQCDVEVSNAARLKHMFKLAFNPVLLRILLSRGWTVLEAAKDHCFITADQPVATYDHLARPMQPWNRPLIAPGVEITLPLSSRVLVRLDSSRSNGDRIHLNLSDTLEMNRRTIIMAERFVFSSRIDDQLKSLIQANAANRAGMTFTMVPMTKGHSYFSVSRRVDVCPAAQYAAS